MKRQLVPLLGFLLAACAGGNSPEEQCERQATQDPAVHAIYARSDGYYTIGETKQRDELLTATRAAVQRCMRAKGLAPPGGVQPVVVR